MKLLTTVIELQTHDSAKQLLFETRYLVQINFTVDLTVRSGNYSGTSHFCVRTDEIETFCGALLKIHDSLSGSTRLSDNDSDGFVKFEMEESRHLLVSGQVGGSHEDHFLRFKFSSDHTCLLPFVADFKTLLNDQGN